MFRAVRGMSQLDGTAVDVIKAVIPTVIGTYPYAYLLSGIRDLSAF
jgi:hypothetical protein